MRIKPLLDHPQEKHTRDTILYIVLCTTIAGVDSWIGIQGYTEDNADFLKTFIELPYDIPT